MKIKRLEDSLAQRIAAGEVIERPASVVKELVENALDAGSERIAIDLLEGGRKRILVRDDGEGMDPDDLRLCVEKHTTSKIATQADLDAIVTLGFRGEALASIAAVARMRIVSLVRGGTTAYEVRVEAGRAAEPSPAARAEGTTVDVEDLFFNLPVRAKFLGTPRTEFFHANRVVHRLALCAAGVSWSLSHDGRSVFDAPRAETLLDRIGQLYGVQVARALIPIEADEAGIRITGYVSAPEVRRGNRRDQLFCINGRPVSDRALGYVLASAYQGILRSGSYPLAVIRIELRPGRVDVNVHPRKEEIRFAEPRRVQDALSRALNQALSSRYVVSSLAGTPGLRPDRSTLVASPSSASGQAPLDLDLRRSVIARGVEREREKVRVGGERRAIGTLQGTYILVEAPDGLEVIDQHIAHERILYEALRAQLHAGKVSTQRFLLPVRLELPFEAAEVLAAEQETLARVGIVLDAFGGGTFILREYPGLLAEKQTQYGFRGVVEGLVEPLLHEGRVEETLFDRLLAQLACSAAVKAGERLPLEEQQDLVERLMTLENPYTCPHGRPIVFAISRQELDRRFRRA